MIRGALENWKCIDKKPLEYFDYIENLIDKKQAANIKRSFNENKKLRTIPGATTLVIFKN